MAPKAVQKPPQRQPSQSTSNPYANGVSSNSSLAALSLSPWAQATRQDQLATDRCNLLGSGLLEGPLYAVEVDHLLEALQIPAWPAATCFDLALKPEAFTLDWIRPFLLMERVALPIWVQHHWVAAVLDYDFLFVADSAPSHSTRQHIGSLLNFIVSICPRPLTVETFPVPRQFRNSSECGVHLVVNTLLLWEGRMGPMSATAPMSTDYSPLRALLSRFNGGRFPRTTLMEAILTACHRAGLNTVPAQSDQRPCPEYGTVNCSQFPEVPPPVVRQVGNPNNTVRLPEPYTHNDYANFRTETNNDDDDSHGTTRYNITAFNNNINCDNANMSPSIPRRQDPNDTDPTSHAHACDESQSEVVNADISDYFTNSHLNPATRVENTVPVADLHEYTRVADDADLDASLDSLCVALGSDNEEEPQWVKVYFAASAPARRVYYYGILSGASVHYDRKQFGQTIHPATGKLTVDNSLVIRTISVPPEISAESSPLEGHRQRDSTAVPLLNSSESLPVNTPHAVSPPTSQSKHRRKPRVTSAISPPGSTEAQPTSSSNSTTLAESTSREVESAPPRQGQQLLAQTLENNSSPSTTSKFEELYEDLLAKNVYVPLSIRREKGDTCTLQAFLRVMQHEKQTWPSILMHGGLADSTHRAHLQTLRWLVAKSVELGESQPTMPLDLAIIFLVELHQELSQWAPTTTLSRLTTMQGALRVLPLYVKEAPSIEMKGCPRWTQTVDGAAIAAVAHLPNQPLPIQFGEAQTAWQLAQMPLAAALELSWLTAGRVKDVLQIQTKDVQLQQGCMVVALRAGKTARKGGYSISVPLPSDSFQHWLSNRPSTQRWLFQGVTEHQVRAAIRAINPKLELRSFRRGRLQYLAQGGMAEDYLLKLSRHASVPMLRRYLNMGLLSPDNQDQAARISAAERQVRMA